MKKTTLIFSILTLSLFLNNCGGGGGGGGGGGVSKYVTEYNNQPGLELINADSVNDAGYTGSGVLVAVVDSGIDQWHGEFRDTNNNFVNLGSGRNYSGSSTNSWYDGYGHGTHVASIIAGERDGTGMRGVAYDATLWSYKIFNDSGASGLTTSEWATLVSHHNTDNMDVSNNSWGVSVHTDDVSANWIESNYSAVVDAYQAAVSDTIFVWAAGNDGDTQTSWQAGMPKYVTDIEDGWLAVVAVDNNLKEPDYTNRCGLAADWCVAAPGGGDDAGSGIYAADNNTVSGYIKLSGTSMAAPHVSGMLANVIQRFPSLAKAEVRTRVLTTATYDGLTDYNGTASSSLSTSQKEAIWGQGLIQEGAATSSIGNYTYSRTSNYYDGNNYNVSQNKFNLPAGLGHSLKQQLMDQDFGVFDSFDGAYLSIKGSEFFKYSPKNSSHIGYNSASSLKTKNSRRNPKTLFYNTSDNKKPFDLLAYSEGPSISITADQQWGNKINFIPKSKLFDEKISRQFEVGLIYNKFNTDVSSFFQSSSENNIDGYGFNIKNQFSNKLSFLSTISKINSLNSNFSITDESINSQLTLENIDYGFNYLATKNFQGFYRKQISKINDVEASNFNFGLNDASIESSVWGMEYLINDKNKFTIGFFNPSHFSNGNLNILTPSGRSTDGTIYWKELNVSAKTKPKSKLFFTSLFNVNENTDIEFNLQQSEYNYDLLGIGEIKLNYHF